MSIMPIAVNPSTGELTYSGSLGSANITDNSVTSADIADATIGVADMSAAALAARNVFLAITYQ